MSLRCKIVGHSWKAYEKNPHRDTNDGYAYQCRGCDKWDWDGENQ